MCALYLPEGSERCVRVWAVWISHSGSCATPNLLFIYSHEPKTPDPQLQLYRMGTRIVLPELKAERKAAGSKFGREPPLLRFAPPKANWGPRRY